MRGMGTGDQSAGSLAPLRAGRRVIPATAEAVRGLLEELERAPDLAALTQDERDCTLLVLAEALNNVVEHGYGGGSGWIAVLPGPGRTGRAWRIVDAAAAPVPEACGTARMPEVPRDGGFGWPLILALTRRVAMRRCAGLNILSLDVRGETGVEGVVAKIA
jgi:serine/threonine-protein kinase RsbW